MLSVRTAIALLALVGVGACNQQQEGSSLGGEEAAPEDRPAAYEEAAIVDAPVPDEDDVALRWEFEDDSQRWARASDRVQSLRMIEESLQVVTTERRGYIRSPEIQVSASAIAFAGKFDTSRTVQVHWRSLNNPTWDDEQSVSVSVVPDGQFHTYAAELADGEPVDLIQVRFTFGDAEPDARLDWVRLAR